MEKTQVVVVGAGPVGLIGAILLEQQGISTILIDSKSDFDDHPRARLYDSLTLALCRQLGVADEVEATGIGPSWTEYISTAVSFAGKQIAKIEAPEFYSVSRPISSQMPVMTSQDLLEPILYERATKCLNLEILLSHECTGLEQDDEGVTVLIRKTDTGEELEVRADYVLGADGVRSIVRRKIDANLEGEVRDAFFRDVLFHADMSRWVDDLDQKAGLLFVAHEKGGGCFQPLDGKKRWRIQIGGLGRDEEITDQWVKEWLWSAVGAGEEFPIEIESKLVWRVGARVCDKFREGRVFLHGDAAHIFAPTGGMGTNCGFGGVYNLTWKLAYVLKGIAPEFILDTYQGEWRLQAQRRTKQALENADFLFGLFEAHFRSNGLKEALENIKQYTHYAGLIFGYEHDSPLVQKDSAEPPAGENNATFIPVVRSGRRAPHLWLDETETVSLGDRLGIDYVVLLGASADYAVWSSAVEAIKQRGFQLRIEKLPDVSGTVYENETAVVVRPDNIVAAHVSNENEVNPARLLEEILPLAA
jgi:2-polyprenyl-6-methoxyphenol hydroxylase-like FAD-dependent oxidoreductase